MSDNGIVYRFTLYLSESSGIWLVPNSLPSKFLPRKGKSLHYQLARLRPPLPPLQPPNSGQKSGIGRPAYASFQTATFSCVAEKSRRNARPMVLGNSPSTMYVRRRWLWRQKEIARPDRIEQPVKFSPSWIGWKEKGFWRRVAYRIPGPLVSRLACEIEGLDGTMVSCQVGFRLCGME